MDSLKVLLVLTSSLALAAGDFVTVYLSQNQGVKGDTKKLRDGTVISIFKNIPFGASTAGDTRFAEPKEAQPWTGVRDALAFGGRCYQMNESLAPKWQFETEDCLNLNIYTPDVNGSLPVMVFIHGGGFDSGSGSYSLYESSTLAANGVVVVTINYRLGPFGFLSTGDDVMPGNYGLLDQVLALKWVQKYIREFGGDPDEVTIFGESAGAACVSLHVLSPLSKGLFKRAIMESGDALNAWAVERPTTLIKSADYAKAIGARVGCNQTTSQAFLDCLRGVSAYSLMVAGENVQEELGVEILATPRVETKFGFLPEYPEDLLAKGAFQKVDTLRGYNSGEYAFVITDDENDGVTREEFVKYFLKITENYAFENSTLEDLKEIIDAEYLRNETDKLALRTSLIRGLTDLLFATAQVLDLDKLLAYDHGNTQHYLYQFNYVVESILNLQSLMPKWMGATHTGELPLVFRDESAFAELLSTQNQKDVGLLTQKLWTNFAKFGNPTENATAVQWAPYTTANREMIIIDVHPSMSSYPRPDFVPIYEKILALFRNKTDLASILG
ncbi:cholinesterase 1-like isoform X1 [Biomphalaria glabrata]|nr:cholinesterase 1-like isoform X1 [Biomphalaria glabrata]